MLKGLKRRHLYKRGQYPKGVEGRGSVELPDCRQRLIGAARLEAEARWSCLGVKKAEARWSCQNEGRGSLELPDCRQRLVGAA